MRKYSVSGSNFNFNDMKGVEIENLLKNGSRLIFRYNSWGDYRYYIDKEENKNRINKSQFEKYKSTCENSDLSEKDEVWFRGSSYCLYYYR